MATVQEISEGVFMISWNQVNTQAYYNYYNPPQQNAKATVKIKKISKLCELTYTTSNEIKLNITRDNDSVQPAVQNVNSIDLNRRPKNTKKTAVQPTVKDVNSLDLNSSPRNSKNSDMQVLEASSVLVVVNGVGHTMTFENSTWTTQFSPTHLCGCGRSGLILNILIDFNSLSMKTETKHVIDHLSNLWETKTLADVTFKFQEREIKAHTLIIASGSPVLAAMFQNDFKEKQERVVVIKDAKSSVFEKMSHFIYTGEAKLDNVDVADLLILANKYGVDSLKEKCALFMTRNLTVDNVIDYLVVSHLHESPSLYKSSLEFISENSEAIVTKKEWVNLMKKYHELSLAAVQMMVLAKKEKKK